MEDDKIQLHIKVREILFRYRATPLTNGQSPAKLYLGRDFRIKLNALRPAKLSKSILINPVVRHLRVGDRVQVRWYDQNKTVWMLGTIKAKFGRLHYRVELDNGYELKRHINQLYKSTVISPKRR
ncbi:Uncharacterized protein K02A2.6 [Eumeta japonica]|uniref:Uncharacterized protein K02A2.6 n=1 Tax=Eumeta variegata TaxID=151549 RepID=A0A4C2ADB2_EUMVA|nr:Uncharacterized protein K02A2.6 [Eumeta japonica]